MNNFMMKMIPVALSEKFPFRCRRCGACCRHVRKSVPLESLDAFRIARFLRDRGDDIQDINMVFTAYAYPVILHGSGYSAYMLKTVGKEDACIFLKNNQCTIHPAKPKACRTYPVSVGPDGHGAYEQFISMEQTHHFEGTEISVEKWLQGRCSRRDYKCMDMEFGSVAEIACLLEAVPQSQKKKAIFDFLYYKYWNFNLDLPFMKQFRDNHQKLLGLLKGMAQESDR